MMAPPAEREPSAWQAPDAIRFEAPVRRRRLSLTPMIDVVFLLLVFFMLAARLAPGAALPILSGEGGTGTWEGPPRLVTVAPGRLELNGVETAPEALVAGLRPLMPGPDAPVILRGAADATLAEIAAAAGVLSAGGIETLVLAE